MRKILSLFAALFLIGAAHAQVTTAPIVTLPYAAMAVADIGNGPIKVRMTQGNASIFTSQGSGTGGTSGSSTSLTLNAVPTAAPLVGAQISGSGIASGTTIAAYDGVTSITLSAAMAVAPSTAVSWGAACPVSAAGIPTRYIQASVMADYYLLYTQARVCAVSPGGPSNTLLTLPIFYDQATPGGGGSANAITALTGDGTATGPGSVPFTLATVNLTPGTFGSATQVARVTVDGKGRVTAVTSITISGVAPGGAAGGDLTGTYPNPTLVAVNPSVGTFGGAATALTISVDAKGRILGVTQIALGGGTPPGGSFGQIQYNNSGAFGGFTMSGDATINTSTGALALTTVLGTPGTFGGAATALQLTADAKGRITGVTNLTISLPATQLTGTLQAAQEPAHTGDVTNSAGSLALTIATVNGNVGTFGGAATALTLTVNAKGQVTGVTSLTMTPSIANVIGLGSGVATAAANSVSAANGFVILLAKGTIALGTSAVSANTCGTATTAVATGVTLNDIVDLGWQGDPTSTAGYTPTASLNLYGFFSATNTVSVRQCNFTGSSITPSPLTLNWSVRR